jgi:uncharacterized membrane protein
MTSSVFLLVLIAAIFHAAWNFAARKAAGNLVAVWLGLWLGCAVVFPGVIGIAVYKGLPETVPAQAIACIIATGLIHSVYFRLLAAGYEHGEISLVYPIARGSGIALTAILASSFFKESFTLLGTIGIGLISLSIISLGTATRGKAHDTKAVTLALSVGASIVAYSLVDKVGVNHVNPVVYIWSMYLIAAIVLTPFVVRRYRGTLGQVAGKYIGYSMIIGIGAMGTYLLILFAFTMGPVGYIVAVRESAVILGAIAGIIFLKERFTITKVFAICVIVVGIIIIKLS